MSTPAIRDLDRDGCDYTIHEYEVEEAVGEGYGEAVAAAIGAKPEQVFKTLMAVVDDVHVVAIVPVTERLSLKSLAAASRGKKAHMAATEDAERLTGYVAGGISPLGQKRRHPTYLDESATGFDRIYVSAGKRGLQVEIAVRDLLRLARAELAKLT